MNELFSAHDDTKEVKALGVKTTVPLTNIKVLVNDVDIAKNLDLKSIKIVADEDAVA